MLLCEKIQARFGTPAAGDSSLILLNEAAIELSVPRRRLYDIINVLEAVEASPRTCSTAHVCHVTGAMWMHAGQPYIAPVLVARTCTLP